MFFFFCHIPSQHSGYRDNLFIMFSLHYNPSVTLRVPPPFTQGRHTRRRLANTREYFSGLIVVKTDCFKIAFCTLPAIFFKKCCLSKRVKKRLLKCCFSFGICSVLYRQVLVIRFLTVSFCIVLYLVAKELLIIGKIIKTVDLSVKM